ncbi:hypothetical protein M0R72_06800 [Candidatus Pacearchaeota archaeon]|jgi:hypothetical protein|nr:hypothetical protein [Candidatus Pacearchaeota archaeon]
MALVNSTGKVAAFYLAKGTGSAYSDEAMSEVNLSAEGYPRYTVYQVTDDTKRYIKDNAAVVFQEDQGITDWQTLTPAEVQYAGGRIFLSSALTSGHAVRVHSGNYYTYAKCLGAKDWRLDMSWVTEKSMCLGDSVPSASLIHKDWTATVGAYWPLTQATLTTSGGDANSHITLTHEPGGTDGNDYELVLVDPGVENATADVSVTGTTITVTLASSAVPAITTTALELVAALSTADAVSNLKITAALAGAETGVGIVAALASPNGALTGGLDATDLTSETAKLIAIFYDTYSSDRRYEGYAVIKGNSITIDPGKLIEQSLTLESCGTPLYFRES